MLDADDLAKIDALLAQRLAAAPPSRAILTLAEAIAYTKHGSHSAFDRWCRRWRVNSGANGRYSRAQLDVGLAREAGRHRIRRAARASRATPTRQPVAA